MKIFLILVAIVLVILFPAHALMLGFGLVALAFLVGFLGLFIAQFKGSNNCSKSISDEEAAMMYFLHKRKKDNTTNHQTML